MEWYLSVSYLNGQSSLNTKEGRKLKYELDENK